MKLITTILLLLTLTLHTKSIDANGNIAQSFKDVRESRGVR